MLGQFYTVPVSDIMHAGTVGPVEVTARVLIVDAVCGHVVLPLQTWDELHVALPHWKYTTSCCQTSDLFPKCKPGS